MGHNPATFVGLVLDNGPENPTDVLVLAAIAERCNADAMAWPSYDDIAQRARIQRRSAMRCVKRLVDHGWLGVRKGHGRGNVNHYVLNMARLKGDPGDTISEPIKGDPSDTISREKVTLATIKGDPGVTRTPKNPHSSSAGRAEHLPVVVGVRRDDDVADKSPNGTPLRDRPQEPAVADPAETTAADAAGTYEQRLALRASLDGIVNKPSRPMRMRVYAALAEGWHASDLNEHLHRAVNAQGGLGYVHNIGGLVVTVLDNLDEPPTHVERPTWCGTCDEQTRMLDWDGDHPRRCPTCNPMLVAATG